MEDERAQAAGMPGDDRRESGQPGGGQGRIDEVGGSGVYPVSSSEGARGDAEIHTPGSWGQGERGAAGYQNHGDSELGGVLPAGGTSARRSSSAGGDTGAEQLAPEQRRRGA